MPNSRTQRISEEYMRALAKTIRDLKDPRVSAGLVSVTRCEVTGDLRYAKAYISVLNAEEQEVLRGLKSAAGYLRREVAHILQLRYAPELSFVMDHSIEHGAHINALLHKLEEE